MSKLKLITIFLLGLGLLIGLAFLLIGILKPKVAGLYIETSPAATVFLNGGDVGQTPYRTTREPGEIVIKLIPDSSGGTPLAPYETRINLTTGVETVLQREFGEKEETSTGEIISFEKVQNDEVSLAVVTMPDSAQILIDGRDRAFTPHKTSSVLAGEHSLVISKEGYLDRVVQIKTHVGYKLTAVVKLAKAGQEPQITPSPSVTPTPPGKSTVEVEILSTPTGFLRVRAEPSTLGEEVGQVTPGKTYPLLDIDAKTGWFKIEFEEGKSGFISNQYARETGSEKENTSATKSASSPSPTKNPTITPTKVP